jgi:hypothetical protein
MVVSAPRRRAATLVGPGGRAPALLLALGLILPQAAIGVPPQPGPDPTAAPGGVRVEPDPAATEPDWIDDQRVVAEQQIGTLIDAFDSFFGDDRRMDVESPTTRLRFKSFFRTSEEKAFSLGGAVSAAVSLPRLEHWLGNARLVVVGETTSPGAPVAPIGQVPPNQDIAPAPPSEVGAPDSSRRRGSTELRFDVVRQGMLVFDTGAGVAFAWPPVPFARFRTHLRLGLGAGYVLRATEVLFVELGGRGAGANTDLLVERFLGTTVRLRWEGHGLYAQRTRGVESSSLVGAEWKVHPRTGLYAGVGCSGFGTPEPGLDVCRVWNGVRRDLWRGWVFGELEPEVAWPRLPGQPRRQVLAVTLRLEVVMESRPSVVGAE